MTYTELELRIKTITELKKIGAIMGVAKYSQKSANELISSILAIQDGTLAPAVMKRGRPKKEVDTTAVEETPVKVPGKRGRPSKAEIEERNRLKAEAEKAEAQKEVAEKARNEEPQRMDIQKDNYENVELQPESQPEEIKNTEENKATAGKENTYSEMQQEKPQSSITRRTESFSDEEVPLENVRPIKIPETSRPVSEGTRVWKNPDIVRRGGYISVNGERFEVSERAYQDRRRGMIEGNILGEEITGSVQEAIVHEVRQTGFETGHGDSKDMSGLIDFTNPPKVPQVRTAEEERNERAASLNVNESARKYAGYVDRTFKGTRSSDAEMRDAMRFMRQKQNTDGEAELMEGFDVTGIVEIIPESFGYVRTSNYHPSDADLYIPLMQIKRFGLRNGDKIKVSARFFPNNKYASVIFIHEINDIPCDKFSYRPRFEDLVPVYPTERIRLEDGQHRFDVALRVIDLVSPIGRGQRGLIVSPPKAGKTTLLKNIAQAILRSYKDIELIMLLVDERPEEVTDMQESIQGAEVVYSTFDMPPEHHTKVAELVLKRAKRLVELGKHVVILMDSITRLARAYNQASGQTGKTLTGGLDAAALLEPKKFFGAARSIKNGGSLTVIATALVDTGSKMDDIIYEEFKGTGNMEIHLSRKMSERRIFPAVDLNRSGTRREDLLMTPEELEGMWTLRRALSKTENTEAVEKLLDVLMTTKNNMEFIKYLKSSKKDL